MNQDLKNFLSKHYPVLLLAAGVFGVLYWISSFNYLLFHATVEIFSILIAFTIFTIAWNARSFLENGYLMFLGITSLFVGSMSLLHTLAFKGMGVFNADANLATQLWLAERSLLAVSFVAAPFFIGRKLDTWRRLAPVVLAYTGVSLLLMVMIFAWQNFPVAYVEGQGLTPFKIAMEYAITAVLLVGAGLLLRARQRFDPMVLQLLLVAIVINAIAELIFTTYISVSDARNLAGHFIKIVGYYLIYKAIVETGILRPYNLLFREFKENERALENANQSLARANAALREEQSLANRRAAQLEAIMDAAPAVVRIAHDPQGRYVTGNRAAYDFFRVPPGTNLSVNDPQTRPLLRYKVYIDNREVRLDEVPLYMAAAHGRSYHEVEEKVVFENGDESYLLANASPLLDDSGQPTGSVAVLFNVTERVKMEKILADSERLYRSLFETMVEGFILQEAVCEDDRVVDFVIREFNPAMERMTGLKREEVLGKTLRYILPETHQLWIERFTEVATTGQSARFEGHSVAFDRYIEVTAFSPVHMQCAALIIDMSERRKTQEDLRQSEARLRRLVESNIVGITFTNDDGSLQGSNDAFLDMIGYTRGELEAGLINWVTMTPPEYLTLDMQGIAEAKERGACAPYEKEYLRKDGARVPVLTGYAYFHEASPRFICFVLDLSERKQAQDRLESYALQLERSNRELQDFAFVASHDLQEPLRKIQAFGERLKERMGARLENEERDYMERMLSASSRMRTMINDLLALSRVTTRGQPFKQVNLNEIADEVLSDLEVRIASANGKVAVGPLPTIEADPMQMHQLLQNLVGNALKFHKDGQYPEVSLYSEGVDGGKSVRIYVKDNGIGFEEEYAERIFQPFQRLHGLGRYEGSGIGLAICRKIVERHSGTIMTQSKPDQGSTFIITLPTRQTSRRE